MIPFKSVFVCIALSSKEYYTCLIQFMYRIHSLMFVKTKPDVNSRKQATAISYSFCYSLISPEYSCIPHWRKICNLLPSLRRVPTTNIKFYIFKWMTAAEHKLTDIPNLYIHFHSLSFRSSKIRATCFSLFCLYSRDDLDRPSRWWEVEASTFHFVHSLYIHFHSLSFRPSKIWLWAHFDLHISFYNFMLPLPQALNSHRCRLLANLIHELG